MKRLLYLLACALPLFGVASCSDDDKDLPNVDFTLNVANGTFVDGDIYAVAGETLEIQGITVTNNESNKNAIITYADYYLDGIFLGRSVVAPYGIKIEIPENAEPQSYTLQINAPVYAVDKSPAFASLFYTIVVVKDAADIPDNGSSADKSTPSIQENEPIVKKK